MPLFYYAASLLASRCVSRWMSLFVYDAPLAKTILSLFEHMEAKENDPTVQNGIHLTSHEEEIMRLVALGYENKAIAEKLVVSVSTVKPHIQNVLLKYQLHDRGRAAVYYVVTKSVLNGNRAGTS